MLTYLIKSHVKAHLRHSKTGKVEIVANHERKTDLRDSQVELQCVDCGSKRVVYRCQVEDGPSQRYKLVSGVYRCKKCWDLKRKELPHWNPNKGENKVLTCAKCSKQKTVLKSQVKQYGKNYHCRNCYLEALKTGDIKQRSNNSQVVTCPDCGKVRMYKPSYAKRVGIYCEKCKNKRERNGGWKGGLVTIICSNCGKEKMVRPNRAKSYSAREKPYRCLECENKNKPTGVNNPAWQGGISFAPYPIEWLPSLRRMIRTRDNYICQICETPLKNNMRKPVHHIDYDKNNNSTDNLITLCHSCHAKTNFNRDHWKNVLTKKMETKSMIEKSRKLEGQIKYNGLDIAIETNKSSCRAWHDPHVMVSGMTLMQFPYGYIRKTTSPADNEGVDVYIGHNRDAPMVYIITQNKAPLFTEVDEQKCMLGFSSAEEAKKAYLKHYNDPRFFRSIQAMPFEEFKRKALATLKKPAMIKSRTVHPCPVCGAEYAQMTRSLTPQFLCEQGHFWYIDHDRKRHVGNRDGMQDNRINKAKGDGNSHPPTICVDFDGVIADYSNGFQGADVFGKPLPGAADKIQQLKAKGCKIIVFTTRKNTPALQKYLVSNNVPFDEINSNSDQPEGSNPGKPIADVYLDDRAIRFKNWNQAVAAIGSTLSLKKSGEEYCKRLGDEMGVDWKEVNLDEFCDGMFEESSEHKDVTGGDSRKTAKIVLAHLKEDPKYYSKLDAVGLAKSQVKISARHLEKSLIHAFTRVLQGKPVYVKQHTDIRQPQPRDDSASTATLSQLGAAARERSKDAKPVKTVRDVIAGLSIEKLTLLRDRLGALPHSRLLNEVQGRPLHFWLATVDRELGLRESAHA